jgi:hypothetical protein
MFWGSDGVRSWNFAVLRIAVLLVRPEVLLDVRESDHASEFSSELVVIV